MASANDIRRGMAINYNGDIAVVLDSQHRTPGNLRAFVQATIRSIRTGKSSDVRFSSTEKIEVVPLMTRKMEFSYKDGEDYVFSDPENYETVNIAPEIRRSRRHSWRFRKQRSKGGDCGNWNIGPGSPLY
jgi:elongation factor P